MFKNIDKKIEEYFSPISSQSLNVSCEENASSSSHCTEQSSPL